MRKVLLLNFLLLISVTGYGQLVVNTGASAIDLVNALVGPGVIVSNITYTGAANSKATFTCAGATCVPWYPSGIMLSTGQAALPVAPASYFASTNMGTPGDAQLNAIVSPLLTQDAAILEFDFSIPSDSVKFEYVFGSEEYNDFVNTSFNDVFAFYISGPGIVGVQNMALLPSTAIPVSINTVNNGGPYGGVSAGPCTNCAYYVDNITGATFYLDGYTTSLVAKAAIQPCQTYRMKIAIADVSDGAYDSGVLLKGGSFGAIGPVTVYANGSPIANNGIFYACTGTTVNLCLSTSPNYTWSTGATTQCISVNEQNINANGIYQAIFVNGGCFGFSEVQVQFVTPSATITPSGPLDLCAGSNVTLSANPGNSYLWSNGATTQNITVNSAGTYTVTVTIGAGCSAVSSPVVVTIGNPSAQITGTLSICNSLSTTLTANAGQSYLWSTGAVSQSISVATAGTYTVTVTHAGGCTASTSAVVTVNSNPVPAIAGTLNICQGTNTTLTATPGFTTYVWSTGGAAANINVNTTGTYTVTVTDANGCTGTASTNVVVSPLPTPAISGTLSFCAGSNSNLNAGAGYTSYLWNNGAATQILPVTAAGTYTVTVTNANNCSASTNAAVVVHPLPSPTITGTLDFCLGTNTTLNSTPGFASYQWSNGAVTPNITVAIPNTFTVTVTDANGCTGSSSQTTIVNPNPIPAITGINAICQGQSTIFNAGVYSSYSWSTGASAASINLNASGTYTVTVTDANGCTGTTSRTLTVNPLPTPSIAGTTTFCQGLNSNLNPGGGFASYLWNTGAATQILNVNSTGNYTVTVTNAFGCSASTSTLVTVNPLPNPNIIGPAAVCIGNSATLNAGAGFASYLWNNGAITQTISASLGGNYTVTVTSGAGCTASATKNLVINPLPTPNIIGVTTICQGEITGLDAGAGYASYQWSTGATSQTINTGTAGNVTVTVTDANGCTAPASANITVNPLPVPVIIGVNAFCDGLSGTLDAGAAFASYLWNTGAITRTINVTTAGPYTVTVTSSSGCVGVDTEMVTVYQNPIPVITGVTDICQGTTSTLNAGGGYASYQWSNGDNTQTISVSSAGNYAVTVTTNNGCVGTTSVATVVNPLPTPFIAGINEICQGTTTTFDAGSGYAGYIWSNGATTQTITPGTANTYTVTVTDANGCSNNTDRILTVNPNPVPLITGDNAFCDGDNSNLNAGAGYVSYLWSTGANGQVVNVNAAGNYVVTVTDINGCLGTTNMAITVHPNPVPVILGGTGICQGASTTLTIPGNYSSYIWNTGEVTSIISVSSAGNYAATVTSAFGCVGSTSTVMVINPLPLPNITGVTEVCQGATTIFDAGSGYSAYLWSNGATGQTISPGLAGQYIVTVTDANGCQNDDNISLVVNPLPTPSISGTVEFCQGDNSNLNAGGGYVNYQWSTGSTSQVLNVNAPGNYAVTVTDNNGCVGSTSTAVVVNALPVPVIAGVNAICDGTTTTFSAGNYSSYIWSNGSVTPSITIGTAGTYEVTVTDANGCVGSSTQALTIYNLPTAVLSGTTDICFGQSTPLSFNFTGVAPFSFTYSNGTTTSPTQTSNAPTASINVAPGTTTIYNLISISDAHCPGLFSGNANITVNPLPVPVISGDLSICDGETTTLTTQPGYISYAWSNSGNLPSIITGAAGIYTVSVTDLNGCVGTSLAVNLVVNAVPVISFTNDTSLTCEIPSINFTNQSVYSSGSIFEWTFGDGGVSNANNPSHLYFVTGNYPVSLTITTPAGCVASSTSNIEIMFFPLPEADFVTAPGVTNVFDSKIGFVDRSSYAISWLWDFGDGGKSFEQNPTHYFNEVGDYRVALTVTNVAGCTDRYEEYVSVNPFFIPNAFTPNGDGVNDVFYNSGYDLDVASYKMNIFNRWGQLVFIGENENDNWNGETINGDIAPAGTYVYRLEVKTRGGKEHVFKGHVNLIR